MTRTIPTIEPTTLRAGDSWQWNRTYVNYPASVWTLTYYLYGASIVDADGFAATASGDEHHVRTLPSYSTGFAAGEYTLVGRVDDGTDTFTVYEDSVEIIGNPLTLGASAQKTHAETMYDLIVAKLEGRIPKDQESFQINGRAVNRIPVAELRKMRGEYASLIEQERAGGDRLGGPVVEIHF